MTQPKAYPKGGRCAACQRRDADCSWRDFESMPPMQKDGDEVIERMLLSFAQNGLPCDEFGKSCEHYANQLRQQGKEVQS
jgi:hypothetical protein